MNIDLSFIKNWFIQIKFPTFSIGCSGNIQEQVVENKPPDNGDTTSDQVKKEEVPATVTEEVTEKKEEAVSSVEVANSSTVTEQENQV